MKYVVLFPFPMSATYYYPKYERKEWIEYKEVPLQMINDRYGIIETDEKATRNINGAKEYVYTQSLEGPLHHSDMWYFYDVHMFRETSREEKLYDVVDRVTGNVLIRTFKGNCRRFLADAQKQGGIHTHDIVEQLVKTHEKAQEKTMQVTMYIIGRTTIRSWKKYQIKEIAE